jgi:hypothetical protein
MLQLSHCSSKYNTVKRNSGRLIASSGNLHTNSRYGSLTRPLKHSNAMLAHHEANRLPSAHWSQVVFNWLKGTRKLYSVRHKSACLQKFTLNSNSGMYRLSFIYGLNGSKFESWYGQEMCLFLQNVQTGSENHPTSNSMNTEVPSLG